MKRLTILFIGIFLFSNIQAKEGMWVPALLKAVEGDMQAFGLKLSAEDIYSINQSSIKDAIVHFGGGCTAEIISDQGLLLTNHHCGYGQIQQHSSLENDYLKDGFWAMTRADELRNPGLTATLIVRIEDVTAKMVAALKDDMDADTRNRILSELKKEIEAAAVEGTNYEATIKPFNYGNEYYMIVTKTFDDVRLVGAPPSAIGKFGGDTDNWMWPRHTGDFSIFRIYAGKDNEPADVSDDNVAYNPDHFLPIAMDGVKEGDFTMVFGFPGRTEQYLTSYAVDYVMNKSNPMRIKMRETSLSIIDAAILSSDQIRIQYSAKQSRISNSYKKWIGQNKGLKILHALDVKRDQEKIFSEASKSNADMLAKFEQLYTDLEKYKFARELFIEYFYVGPEIMKFTQRFQELFETYGVLEEEGKVQETIDGLKASTPGFFKDYQKSIDKNVFIALTELYLDNIDSELKPEHLGLIDRKFKGNISAYADFVYEKSIFTDEASVLAMLDKLNGKSLKKLKQDPAYRLMMDVYGGYFKNVRAGYGKYNSEIDLLMKDYVMELQSVFPDRSYWADANSTMRLTYGKAEGSEPRDGMMYKFYSTTEGILQKYDPNNPDYVLPERLVELIEKKDFGKYTTDGEMRVCFTGSNHTTGGNSGSPTLDANGHLIGLNFDRSWESTMSDIMFDPDRCRNIMVDIKYVLFIIDKYAGAKHLVDEMELYYSQKEKPEMEQELAPIKQ